MNNFHKKAITQKENCASPIRIHDNFVKFNLLYFATAIILFIIEILIARYAHDKFVRPYIGDLLGVILLYCFIKSFIVLRVLVIAAAVLAFSYIVEVMQYFNIINKLGLQHSKIARVVMGTSFAWMDILAYTIGIALMLCIEKAQGNIT
ncbi:MAG: DUF2809 domain-containing protein [Ferruginibacter sp.]